MNTEEMIACTQTSLLKKTNESHLPGQEDNTETQQPSTNSKRLSTN